MNRQEWIDKCNHWKAKWPVMQPEYLDDSNGLNIYAVLDAIFTHAPDDAVFMADAGTAFYTLPQAVRIRAQQRIVMSQSQGDMGWALPASIGVAMAGAKNVICIVGDGSFMSNVQELAVILNHNLPIKIIVLNNKGYLSIKNTQSKFYNGRVYGVNKETGLWFPDFEQLASTFGISSRYVHTVSQFQFFKEILCMEKPVLIDVQCTQNQQLFPSQGLKDGKQMPLHNMAPFLSDEELAAEMVVPL
jgi:acetolactate synthase-1/2/3 large subunit